MDRGYASKPRDVNKEVLNYLGRCLYAMSTDPDQMMGRCFHDNRAPAPIRNLQQLLKYNPCLRPPDIWRGTPFSGHFFKQRIEIRCHIFIEATPLKLL